MGKYAAGYLASTPVATESLEGYVAYELLGTVHAVELPVLADLSRGVAILMAGNAVVLKHASNVPQCALAV